jgi:hypothetical protein
VVLPRFVVALTFHDCEVNFPGYTRQPCTFMLADGRGTVANESTLNWVVPFGLSAIDITGVAIYEGNDRLYQGPTPQPLHIFGGDTLTCERGSIVVNATHFTSRPQSDVPRRTAWERLDDDLPE